MQTGDVHEAAMWVWDDGPTHDEASGVVAKALKRGFAREGWLHTEPSITVLSPGDERVPEPPTDADQRNPQLVYGTAKAVCPRPQYTLAGDSIIHDLEPKDLARLRKTVVETHRRLYPGHADPTQAECDAMVDQVAPETVRKLLAVPH